MKILIVLPNDSLGGAEQYLKMIARYYCKEDIDILFLNRHGGNNWIDFPDSISLKYLSRSSYFQGFFNLLRLLLFKKSKLYNRIYTSHIYITSLVGVLITFGLIKKEKFIARESTSIFKRFSGFKLLTYKLAYHLGYKHIDLLICQTEFMKKQLIEGFPGIRKRTTIKVLENPIDLELIRWHENKSINFALPENFIVSAGRLIVEKGFDILIEAFAEIRIAHPEVELLILGEGAERGNLEQLAIDLKVEQCVHLPGRVSNVYPYFQKAVVCVVSSRIEGFPNVLLQMMSQNTKVVSTLCAGGIDTISGLITIPPENKVELTKSMHFLLNKDRNENRDIFDKYLRNRDISNFIVRLEHTLQN